MLPLSLRVMMVTQRLLTCGLELKQPLGHQNHAFQHSRAVQRSLSGLALKKRRCYLRKVEESQNASKVHDDNMIP